MRYPPTFDTWTVIFLFAAIQGLVLALIMFYHGNKKSRSQKMYVTTLMVLFCLQICEYVLWWTGYIYVMPHLMRLTASFTYLFGPILFFYFRSIFRNQGFQVKKDWGHLGLFFIFIAFHINEYLLSADEKTLIINTVTKTDTIPWPWLNLIQLCMYTIICYYEYQSEAENTKEVKKWFRLILVLFSLFIAASLAYYALVRLPWFNPTWDYMISGATMVFIYSIAIYAYFNDKVFNGFDLTENTSKSKYQNSALKNEFGNHILSRLNELMDREKLYVDDEINLDRLAARLNITRHQLSQVLNERAEMNFFEYINSRRIQEAKQLLTSTSKKELNIIEIAYKVGYTNKVTFNNTFKKYTGMTPSDFRSSAHETEKGQILPIRDSGMLK
jgi:AraC-like DNA-binding protein